MNSKIENGEIPEVEFEVQEEPVEEDLTKCRKCHTSCLECCRPVLAHHHPLSDNPSLLQRLHFAFLCPPHGRIGACFFVVLVGALWWGVLWSLTGDDALPGGNFFSLLPPFFFLLVWRIPCQLGEATAPLGMLIVGGILGNVPGIDIAKDINQSWGSGARQIALTVILIRAGLGLDPKALRRLSFAVLRLAFSPCLSETVAIGVAAYLILDFPWPWGFMLGFVISAVSPAVVVPSLLSLSERGYGIDKGIPTLVIAAASLDDVLAITGFGVLLGISFSTGDIAWNICKGPLEAVIGIVYGMLGGIILWYIPQKKSRHLLLFRSAMLLGGGMLAVFGSKMVDWAGAGPLGCLTISFVAALRWRSEVPKGKRNPVEGVTGVLWMIFQPLLFGLIGAQVNIASLEPETVGKGIGVLTIGLVVRMVVSFLAVFGTNLNLKERLFIPIAWLPKATVQAAIGSLALDTARDNNKTDLIPLGEQILTLAVLSILMTAPLGAVLIVITGKRLLNQTPDFDPQQRKSIITMAFDQDSLLSLQELNNSTWLTRTGEENDVSQPMIDSSKTTEEKENGNALQDLTARK
ncbi:sodium/hydrogen exchanger 9B2-like isoform X1 [Pomacea canaliculata]|uniref:sodium/hydrogen exchanger 9B2-like isoform X1 n=1 Tax=Pomacea canaliculata TaxID=400727 RepID=UPI000D73B4F8|nr:sodium/hydrogen exchanger 9B2-like isoform X1 [Pomacea canaliculata]XP_025095644.1 sodium/hydrogen exchanger 9B2-like isoform X1 [Pomacea canaliculata]